MNTRVDVQLSPDLYAQIEEIARQQKARVHHISKKPIIKDAVIDLLKIGLAHYGQDLSDSDIRQLPDTDLIDNRIQAAIAPILARLEKLEEIPPAEPVAILPNEPEPTPLLEYLDNQAIATDTPSECLLEVTESEFIGNHAETTVKPVTGDFSGGLDQECLAKHLNCSKFTLSRMTKEPNFAEWSRKKDPNGTAWRSEGTGKKLRYYPVTD